MTTRGKVKIERMRYWQGQKLRARDFSDQVAGEAQLRWWHNRALHNTFGVREGFKLFSVEPGTNAQAAIEPGVPLATILVQPGLAYDGFGRELILQTVLLVPVPAIQSEEPI